MARSIRVGTHGCVVDPGVKDAGVPNVAFGGTRPLDLLRFAGVA
jgi:hypothetical protein